MAPQTIGRESPWDFDGALYHLTMLTVCALDDQYRYGYHRHGPETREETREIIRREVEQCDSLDGFVVLSSLAGGTGSGVGTFVTETLRDDYGRNNIMNHVIWP